MDEFVGKEIARIRDLVGKKGQVIGTSPRHMQGLHGADMCQALYLGELIPLWLQRSHMKQLAIGFMRF